MQVILDELKQRRDGAVSIESMVDSKVLERPGNDIGREMEVLLYGKAGGFASKIDALAAQTYSVVQIQCLYGAFSLVRRVRRRREARVLVAALYIQKVYRKRLSLYLSDQANRLAMAAAQHRENYLAEREKRMQTEIRQKADRERKEQRVHVIRKRWVALRSCVRELLERKRAATRVQCLIRSRKAREEYFHKTLEKRSRIRELRSTSEVEPKAMLIQARIRAHRASSTLLVSQYNQRVKWYDDSRTAVMLAPLARHLAAKRRELQLTLRQLQPELARLSDSPKQHIAALRRLWAVQGEAQVLEQLMSHASIDVLMKRRLEFKLAMQGAFITLERTERNFTAIETTHDKLVEETHRVRGSLEVMERLQLSSETVTVLTAGQSETLRRKLAYLELKLDSSNKALTQAREAYHGALKNERAASNALALCSTFLSRHAQVAPLAPDGQNKQGYLSQPHLIPTSAFLPLLDEKRKMIADQLRVVNKCVAERQCREALLIVCHWAGGGLVTINSLHASTFRAKLERLERRRAEALGHCIATANAKIAYRVCKQSMAELHGARELLEQLEGQQATMPCATIELVLSLPNSSSIDEALCDKALEDMATWMGVSDDRFELREHSVKPADEDNPGGKGGKNFVSIVANLKKGLFDTVSDDDDEEEGAEKYVKQVAPMLPSAPEDPSFNPEPVELGEAVVTEWLEGRLAGGMTGTAEVLGISKIEVHSVVLQIPTRQELGAHMPTLEAMVDESGYELQSTITYIDHCDAAHAAELERAEQLSMGTPSMHADQARRLLSKKEISFFKEVPVSVSPADSALARMHGNVVGAPRSPSSISTEASQALREAIHNDPIAMRAVTLFTTLRQYAPQGSAAPQGGSGVKVSGGEPSVAEVAKGVNEAAAAVQEAAAAQAFSHATADHESPDNSPTAVRPPATARSPGRAGSAGRRVGGIAASKFSIAKTALGTVKGRLTYSKMRRDALRGKLEAIHGLRTETRFPALCVPGDPRHINLEWNKGLNTTSDATGKFCAYCAQRTPPVLARHRFIECQHRRLAGQPEFSLDALRALEIRMKAKEERVRGHLRRFSQIVVRRKQCKAILAEVQGVLHYLRPSAVLPSDVPLPIGPPPKSVEPHCRIRSSGHTAVVRFLAQHMAKTVQERTSDMRELRLSGGMNGGVWGELKALLVMTPRRSLMLGGMKELYQEEILRQRRASDAEGNTDSADAIAALAPTEGEGEDDYFEDDLAVNHLLDMELGGNSGAGESAEIGTTSEEEIEGIAETVASALQTAPLRTIPSGGAAYQLGDDPLGNACDHLPAETKRRAYERQAEQRSGVNQEPSEAPEEEAEEAEAEAGDSPRKPRRGSLSNELWRIGGGRQLIDPQTVLEQALQLGMELSDESAEGSDFYLLPLIIESCRAPLPGGWQEVLRDGNIFYVEETSAGAPPTSVHPLAKAFEQIVMLERRRRAKMTSGRMSKLPQWLDKFAERWLQFVDESGQIYFYDFATGEIVHEITEILAKCKPKGAGGRRRSGAGSLGKSAPWAVVTGAAQGIGYAMQADGTAAEPPTYKKAEAENLFAAAAASAAAARRDSETSNDELDVLSAEIARSLRATFHQVLGASLATAPRPLRQTLEVAAAYGIQIETEANYLWLADLALSLPLPAGWVQLDHPTEHRPYWHNEICGSSQWQHPVDDFIKATIKMQRQPLSPQVQVMRRSRLPRKRRGTTLHRGSLASTGIGNPGGSKEEEEEAYRRKLMGGRKQSTLLGNSFKEDRE